MYVVTTSVVLECSLGTKKEILYGKEWRNTVRQLLPSWF